MLLHAYFWTLFIKENKLYLFIPEKHKCVYNAPEKTL